MEWAVIAIIIGVAIVVFDVLWFLPWVLRNRR